MANDIPGYGARDALPWNTQSGKPIGPMGSDELAFDTDIRSDPAETRNVCDPATGWDSPPGRTKVSEV